MSMAYKYSFVELRQFFGHCWGCELVAQIEVEASFNI